MRCGCPGGPMGHGGSIMSFTNQDRSFRRGTIMHIDEMIRTPDGLCQPNGGIIPIGTLAAQPPDDWCRPNRGRGVLHPGGTRGAVGWMRGPGACPGGDATGWPHATQTHRHATRTSTRPPSCSTSTPCPYRTQADLSKHSPIRLAKIRRGRLCRLKSTCGHDCARDGRINSSMGITGAPPMYRPMARRCAPQADKSAPTFFLHE